MMTKQEAGSIGGKMTFKRYGRQHMAEIGRRGAVELYRRYNLAPVDLNRFALVDRITGKVKAIRTG